jgi:amidophosphoribosyltransferase
LRQAGATEVHLRVASPPIRHPCFMGVDMATRDQLIAARMSVDEIARHLGVNSLGYLSLEGLRAAVGQGQGGHCQACFTGDYPVAALTEMSKMMFEPG